MKIQFPYPGKIQQDYFISQLYESNPVNPETGGHFYLQHHGGWDIVPLKNSNFWPAPIYPVLPGLLLFASTTDKNRGLGIKVQTSLNQSIIEYFKAKGLIPNEYTGEVWLEHMYWHMLTVLDVDGYVDQKTAIGATGNSGYVFAGGLSVPSYQINVPPYPGGHLHFECLLRSPNEIFNTKLDNIGRFNPEILFAYEGNNDDMPKYFKVDDHGKLGIMILEGFSGTIVFENNFQEYQTLLKITGITDQTPTIQIP